MGGNITPGPEAPPTHLPDMPAGRAPEKQGPETGGLDPQAEGHGPQDQANRECGNLLGNYLCMWQPGHSRYLLLVMSIHEFFQMSLLFPLHHFFLPP